ncbi:MAG: penicillin-binding protein 2 [Solirubrobacterales bacterium]
MEPRFGQEPRRPRLSMRVAVVGGCAVALFAILFFRLWNLQVLDGDQYLAEAKNNRSREYKVPAPRGDILDRNGEVLVDNRTSLALQINTAKLPADPAAQKAELTALGKLVGISLKQVRRKIRESEEKAAGAPVTLRRDVGDEVVFYLEENQAEFPGVSVQRVFVRAYPNGTEAAHLVGSVGQVSEEDLEEPQYEDLEPGDEVGKGGVEETYDEDLRGTPGFTRVQVNALGQPTPGGTLVNQPPEPGNNLKLTIDSKVQEVGEAEIAATGLAGGFVTMDIHSGEILGLASAPTFDPAILTKPTLTQAEADSLFNNPSKPLVDRVTESFYPTGSTFKIFPALAALEAGIITPSEQINDTGVIEVAGQPFANAGEEAYGPVDLHKSLEVSSDIYYYLLGLKMWDSGELQKWLGRFGIGQKTGIDLPLESEGLVPSQEWRNQLFAEGKTDREWSAGDNMQLATGQGDLQTDPLQMAVAYAALGNGGTIVTPHLGLEVEDAAGRPIEAIETEPRRKIKFKKRWQEEIMSGLHAAAQAPGGTSYDTFKAFPIDIAGKTGTAERPPNGDQAWFAVLAPYPNPRIVTIVSLEEGGFGAESAAPVAARILEAYFGYQPGETAEDVAAAEAAADAAQVEAEAAEIEADAEAAEAEALAEPTGAGIE